MINFFYYKYILSFAFCFFLSQTFQYEHEACRGRRGHDQRCTHYPDPLLLLVVVEDCGHNIWQCSSLFFFSFSVFFLPLTMIFSRAHHPTCKGENCSGDVEVEKCNGCEDHYRSPHRWINYLVKLITTNENNMINAFIII